MNNMIISELLSAARQDLNRSPELRNLLMECGYSMKDSVQNALKQELENSVTLKPEEREYVEKEILKFTEV